MKNMGDCVFGKRRLQPQCRRDAYLHGLLSVVVFVFALSASRAAAQTSSSFMCAGHKITYETFTQGAATATLILLPGSSGPDAAFYRDQAAFYSQHGFRVLLLHYYDAADSRAASEKTYSSWAQSLSELVAITAKQSPDAPVEVIGYSLGASVALAAGSQGLSVSAIAEWYGSLPDYAFYKFQSMPPLLILHGARDANIPVANAHQLMQLCGMKEIKCESNIYPDEAHGFSGTALTDAQRRTLEFFASHAVK